MQKIWPIVMVIIFGLAKPVFALDVSAEYACVMVADTSEVVYAKNAYTQYPMASTTKIMTALLALENCEPADVVTVSWNASGQEGSSMYLRPGDKLTMENLLYGLMLNSGNDAAVAVAEHIAGNTEAFAQMMTERAKELGAESTQFKNPNGLDAAGHFTTAYDLALITRAAMENETFRQIVGTKTKTVPLLNGGGELYLANHNKMLRLYEGATGVKTGYTKSTGRCLVSAARRNGVSLIAVTLAAPDDWNDHARMLDAAFSQYARVTVLKKGDCLREITVGDAVVRVLVGEDVQTVCRQGEKPTADVVLHLAENLTGPVHAGEKIGYMAVRLGESIKEVPLLCDRSVERKISAGEQLYMAFLRVVKLWFLQK